MNGKRNSQRIRIRKKVNEKKGRRLERMNEKKFCKESHEVVECEIHAHPQKVLEASQETWVQSIGLLVPRPRLVQNAFSSYFFHRTFLVSVDILL